MIAKVLEFAYELLKRRRERGGRTYERIDRSV
jgi:hypothetical protein